jgi:hypothetical protein
MVRGDQGSGSVTFGQGRFTVTLKDWDISIFGLTGTLAGNGLLFSNLNLGNIDLDGSFDYAFKKNFTMNGINLGTMDFGFERSASGTVSLAVSGDSVLGADENNGVGLDFDLNAASTGTFSAGFSGAFLIAGHTLGSVDVDFASPPVAGYIFRGTASINGPFGISPSTDLWIDGNGVRFFNRDFEF